MNITPENVWQYLVILKAMACWKILERKIYNGEWVKTNIVYTDEDIENYRVKERKLTEKETV